jgi:hypothetical protein
MKARQRKKKRQLGKRGNDSARPGCFTKALQDEKKKEFKKKK